MDDRAALEALNTEYIRCVQAGDVAGFERILAPEFYCSNPDGSLVDRAGFLAQTARPVTIRGLVARDVLVRILGVVASNKEPTQNNTQAGERRRGRYTDVWARQEGRWLAVSAHVTR